MDPSFSCRQGTSLSRSSLRREVLTALHDLGAPLPPSEGETVVATWDGSYVPHIATSFRWEWA